MVQFKNVSKYYSDTIHAVKDISFVINEGEFVFLIGPSGSGKTTLIELLIRDQIPSEGKIFFNDKDITHIGRQQVYRLRRQIGVIFQDFKLIPDKTAYENVAFAMEAAGRNNKEIKDTVPYVLDIVGLGERINAFPEALSGGEQQRVAIARAIANNPKLLIADEPTGNLDPASAWDIVQILTKINNWGTTVIMSTHGTDIVNTLNKRVVQMEKGIVIRDDSKGQYEFTENVDKKAVKEALIDSDIPESKSTFKVTISSKTDKEKSEKIDEKDIEAPSVPINANAAGLMQPKQEKRGLFAKFFGGTTKFEEEQAQESENIQNDFEESQIEGIENEEKVEPSEEELMENRKEKIKLFMDLHQSNTKMADNIENKKKKEKKATKQKIKKEDEKLEQIINKFTKMPVDYLNLSRQVISDLKSSGYKYIGQILEDGPEKVSQNIAIDPEEVVMLAKSIDKLIKTELNK